MSAQHTPGPLTPSEVESMRAVADGADVLAYGIAKDLRAVQERFPGFVRIGARMGNYKGHEQMPYFGAILTPAGRKAIAVEKTCSRCRESWPADGEFFRIRSGYRIGALLPWCRACEAAQKAESRSRRSSATTVARAAIAKATGGAA